ncbi:modular serine protease isoform X2 [Bactrocera oleae]|uniref:modular serine protease isoform X2 n=1 Tax=Bactrocera oleae TaxID=104688 RepID=UPI00387E8B06
MHRICSALFLISALSSIARKVSIATQITRSNCTFETNKWPCRSGACISIYEVCDGMKNCRDSSDENEEVCRDMQCTAASFRCDYGACIPIEQMCDGVDDCVDSSDEERQMCLKRRLDAENDEFGEEAQRKKCDGFGQMKCWSGQCVRITDKCNGIVDCDDRSDEWPNLCATVACDKSTHFKCNYGACIVLSAKCNGTAECMDKSDEAEKLCKKANESHGSHGTSTTTISNNTKTQPNNATVTITRIALKYLNKKYQPSQYCPYKWIDSSDCCTYGGRKVMCQAILPKTIVHKGCQYDTRNCYYQCNEKGIWKDFGC